MSDETKHLSVRIYRREPFLNVWEFFDKLPVAAGGRREGLGRHIINALSDYVEGLQSEGTCGFRFFADPSENEALLTRLEEERQRQSASQFNRFLLKTLAEGLARGGGPDSGHSEGSAVRPARRRDQSASRFSEMEF